MRRRDVLAATALGAASSGRVARAARPAHSASAAGAVKTLHLAFPTAETGFDPAQISDLYSAEVISLIFESPLTYDYLARPVRLRAQTAVDLPEASDNFRRFVFTIRPGILFADHAAFGGKPRELVAEDYVYAVKRFYDPKYLSENIYQFETLKLLDLSELRERAQKSKQPFPYDEAVRGIRALDRYRFEVRTAEPAPRLPELWATPSVTGAVAREVVEYHNGEPGALMADPVGTGPYRLESWRRSSRVVLARNPRFREQRFDAAPAPDDAFAQAIAEQLRGKTLPLIDRIEWSVIDEAQPRWLAFAQGQLDVLAMPFDLVPVALPGGALAPHLAKRGVRLRRELQSDLVLSFFNMDDPVVGGLDAPKVALRRAVALGYDALAEARLLRHGQAVPAQSIVPPFNSGFVAGYKSEMSEHSPARAKALLDLYGYLDRDGDGWRETPDGKPLTLRLATQSDQTSRRLNELWRRSMNAIGIRIEFEIGTWAEQLKRSRAGALQMWSLGWQAGSSDGGVMLGLGYGPNANESNDARFKLKAFDELYARQATLADGPEREALMRRLKDLLVAYMPYKVRLHTINNDLSQSWVQGYWRHPFMRSVWRYVDIDDH